MALTNRMLKTMGIEEEQRDQIMEAHQDTLREIREERDQLRDQAAKVPDLQRQLQEAQEAAEANAGDEWRERYEAEHRALEDYRQKVEAEEQERSKARAYRDMLVTKANVDPKRVDRIMRLIDLSKVELDEDGAVRDADEAAKAAAEEWADFVVTKRTEGSDPENPPADRGGKGPKGVSDIAARVIREYNSRNFGLESKEGE